VTGPALTVLDQTPVFAGAGPAVAAREAVALAAGAEGLGYARFWIAEHHAVSSACGSPEVLVAAAAAATHRLRVGSGAVLLPYYAPLKVATTFNLLCRLYPGRIDLGVGRGPGAGPATAARLGSAGPDSFEPKLTELVDLVGAPGHDQWLPAAEAPQLWVTGGGPGGMVAAAGRGLPFAFAQFVHDEPHPDWADRYRQGFRPGVRAAPRFCLAVRVACADSPADVHRLGALVGWLGSPDHRRYVAEHRTMPSWTQLRDLPPLAGPRTAATLVGTPEQVAEQLSELVAAYRPDELAVTTACPPFDLRVRTYELLERMCAAPATAR
jgi:luciferase family oxidoreductase group 1